MKLAISYFYQIRFFKPYMIPFSTAVWDPKWYHQNKGPHYNYVDSNGVLVGLGIKSFKPGKSCDGLCHGPEVCATKDPTCCPFLTEYRKQIDSYSYKKIQDYFENTCYLIKNKLGFEEEPLPVLIVYETPDNPCSERIVLLNVLRNKGFDIAELQYPIQQYY